MRMAAGSVYVKGGPDAHTPGPGERARFPSLRGVDARRPRQDATQEAAGLDPAPLLRLCADA